MLDDHHAGDIGREALQDFQGGFCAPCGSAQADDGAIQIRTPPDAGGRDGGQRGGGGRDSGAAADLGAGGDHDLLGEGVQKGLLALCAVRLPDKIHCPGGQGVKDLEVQRRDQDHRKRGDREQLLEKIDPIGAWHLHVQGHHIGRKTGDLSPGVQSVDRIANDFDIRIGRKPASKKGAGDSGVVHNENADFAVDREHGNVLSGLPE